MNVPLLTWFDINKNDQMKRVLTNALRAVFQDDSNDPKALEFLRTHKDQVLIQNALKIIGKAFDDNGSVVCITTTKDEPVIRHDSPFSVFVLESILHREITLGLPNVEFASAFFLSPGVVIGSTSQWKDRVTRRYLCIYAERREKLWRKLRYQAITSILKSPEFVEYFIENYMECEVTESPRCRLPGARKRVRR